jgi:hypothetical protein
MPRSASPMSPLGAHPKDHDTRLEDYVSQRVFDGAHRLSEQQAAEIRATYERIYGPISPSVGSHRHGRRTFDGF